MKNISLKCKTLGIALLLGATCGLALPAAAAGPDAPMGMGMGMGMGPGMGPDHGGMMGGAGMRAGHLDRLLADVKATPEQRAQIAQIRQAAETDLRAQADAGRALHLQMQQLLSQPTLDAAAIEAQRAQMSAHHDAVSKRMTQALLDGARVLSPEQRKLVAERMAQRRGMMERHRQERNALDKPRS